jgi:hypothetical protein
VQGRTDELLSAALKDAPRNQLFRQVAGALQMDGGAERFEELKQLALTLGTVFNGRGPLHDLTRLDLSTIMWSPKRGRFRFGMPYSRTKLSRSSLHCLTASTIL